MFRKIVSIGVVLTVLITSLVLVGSSVSAGVCIQVTVNFYPTRQTTMFGKVTAEYSVDGTVIGTEVYENLQGLGVIPGGTNVVIGRFRVLLDIDDADRFDVILIRELTISGGGVFSADAAPCGGLELYDGRLNPTDAAALAIIYPTSAGGYDIFAIDPATSRGELVIRATRRQVNAALAEATAPGGVNTLIDSFGDITLWALNSGECQLNSLYEDGSLNELIFQCAADEPAAG